jgi:hypothetical protein
MRRMRGDEPLEEFGINHLSYLMMWLDEVPSGAHARQVASLVHATAHDLPKAERLFERLRAAYVNRNGRQGAHTATLATLLLCHAARCCHLPAARFFFGMGARACSPGVMAAMRDALHNAAMLEFFLSAAIASCPEPCRDIVLREGLYCAGRAAVERGEVGAVRRLLDAAALTGHSILDMGDTCTVMYALHEAGRPEPHRLRAATEILHMCMRMLPAHRRAAMLFGATIDHHHVHWPTRTYMLLTVLPALLDSGLLDARGADDLGWTLLHFAALYCLPEVARMLVRFGADPAAQTADGWTAAEIADLTGPGPAFASALEEGACARPRVAQ